ncbi:CBS domain-containing protein [Allomuricauda sp. SCSIO 65647]|uniref:CBS domain-containing protein n=1 Tax=Allomuricauda sp. SCSIO 65647 TaxID=2908843 RepID=UPI001F33C6EF|nr:CBS domain-containing protein [Muricauda sp. SCSIO 65647]UJH68464.1 CBS domain-containing protein [Muricauda sp. SCSIO 65647]
MGEMITSNTKDAEERMAFVQHLIDDVETLELLLQNEMFEDDVVRVGAEQELCLIDKNYRPYGINLKLLNEIDDAHFTTELASYNIEINLDPFELKNNCFSLIENQLRELLQKADDQAKKNKAHLLLAGILPTIGKKEVGLDYLTPIPRYFALNEMLKAYKGDDFNLKIRGVDELYLKHDSVMFEACNTSFQLHLQVPSHDFISSYNWAQAIAGPVLSVCCNSPMLMGRELWKETRIALFQQSLDTRRTAYALRNQTPRVGFGDHWEEGSVAEIFKKDISKHRILLTKPIAESSLQKFKKGEISKLPALCLHNGTIYRWNRPCYGVGNGKPHLRIENRYIPSGPSVIDEMANFAFWVGLMKGRPKVFDDMPSQMDFKSAKTNFIKAARSGKETVFLWCGELYSAKKLILNKLLPIAYKGLHKCGVDEEDIERLLGVIEGRTKGMTGEQWQVANMRTLKQRFKTDKSLVLLTKKMVENQSQNLPIHRWEHVNLENIRRKPKLVKEIMTTHLFKLHEDDLVSMAQAIMQWNGIHHIPVENDQGDLSGLLTWSYLQSLATTTDFNNTKVSEIMIKEVMTASPEMEIGSAKTLLGKHDIGCLPVVLDNTLVGIISRKDI